MTRREKARIVADRVAARIREVSPEGLGRWAPAFDFVATVSDTFMDALAEWEKEDSTDTRLNLEVASTTLIGAWAEAARRWREAGRPPLEEMNANEVESDVGELVS